MRRRKGNFCAQHDGLPASAGAARRALPEAKRRQGRLKRMTPVLKNRHAFGIILPASATLRNVSKTT